MWSYILVILYYMVYNQLYETNTKEKPDKVLITIQNVLCTYYQYEKC